MTFVYRVVLIVVFVIAGALGGRVLARQQCLPCYNNISDGGPFGKFKNNQCFMGVCQNSSTLTECYKETCSACKWNVKKRTGCQGGENYTCSAQGNCPDNEPVVHHVCVNLCGC